MVMMMMIMVIPIMSMPLTSRTQLLWLLLRLLTRYIRSRRQWRPVLAWMSII